MESENNFLPIDYCSLVQKQISSSTNKSNLVDCKFDEKDSVSSIKVAQLSHPVPNKEEPQADYLIKKERSVFSTEEKPSSSIPSRSHLSRQCKMIKFTELTDNNADTDPSDSEYSGHDSGSDTSLAENQQNDKTNEALVQKKRKRHMKQTGRNIQESEDPKRAYRNTQTSKGPTIICPACPKCFPLKMSNDLFAHFVADHCSNSLEKKKELYFKLCSDFLSGFQKGALPQEAVISATKLAVQSVKRRKINTSDYTFLSSLGQKRATFLQKMLVPSVSSEVVVETTEMSEFIKGEIPFQLNLMPYSGTDDFSNKPSSLSDSIALKEPTECIDSGLSNTNTGISAIVMDTIKEEDDFAEFYDLFLCKKPPTESKDLMLICLACPKSFYLKKCDELFAHFVADHCSNSSEKKKKLYSELTSEFRSVFQSGVSPQDAVILVTKLALETIKQQKINMDGMDYTIVPETSAPLLEEMPLSSVSCDLVVETLGLKEEHDTTDGVDDDLPAIKANPEALLFPLLVDNTNMLPSGEPHNDTSLKSEEVETNIDAVAEPSAIMKQETDTITTNESIIPKSVAVKKYYSTHNLASKMTVNDSPSYPVVNVVKARSEKFVQTAYKKLESFMPKSFLYKVASFSTGSVEGLFKADLQMKIKSTEEVDQWMREFQDLSGIIWEVQRKFDDPSFKFKQIYRCLQSQNIIHHSEHKVRVSKLDMACPGRLTISVKQDHVKQDKTHFSKTINGDKVDAPGIGFLTILNLRWEHNHETANNGNSKLLLDPSLLSPSPTEACCNQAT